MWMMWWVKVDHNTGVYVPYYFRTVVSFTSHKNQISVSAVRRDLSRRGSKPWPPAQQTDALPTEPTRRRFKNGNNFPQRTGVKRWTSYAHEVGGYLAEDQKQYEFPAWINYNWSVHVNCFWRMERRGGGLINFPPLKRGGGAYQRGRA